MIKVKSEKISISRADKVDSFLEEMYNNDGIEIINHTITCYNNIAFLVTVVYKKLENNNKMT